MRRLLYRYRSKTKMIIGVTLSIIGFLIILNVIKIEFLLILIGIALLVMGGLLLTIK